MLVIPYIPQKALGKRDFAQGGLGNPVVHTFTEEIMERCLVESADSATAEN